MCTGMEIAALAGSALSAAGGLAQQSEAAANAKRQAKARNDELNRTLQTNDKLAQQSRDAYNQRQQTASADAIKQDQQAQTANRDQTLQQAVQPADQASAGVSISGSAPTVVKSELAKKMADVMATGKQRAQNLATLGGYGDSWLNQGLQDQNTGLDLGVNSNFSQGNMATLPYRQDVAETRAYKPISPIGGLLQGFGSMLGSYAGGGGTFGGFGSAVPKKDPWAGLRTVV